MPVSLHTAMRSMRMFEGKVFMHCQCLMVVHFEFTCPTSAQEGNDHGPSHSRGGGLCQATNRARLHKLMAHFLAAVCLGC